MYRHLKTLPIHPDGEAPPVDRRPRCPWCGKPLRPLYEEVGEDLETIPAICLDARVWRYWKGRYDGYGAFDRLSCAAHWANRRILQDRGEV